MSDELVESVKSKIEEIENQLDSVSNESAVYPLIQYYLNKDNDLNKLKERNLNQDNCYEVLKQFQYLMMIVNRKALIVPTRELFCSLIGMSTQLYNDVLNSPNNALNEVFKMIEDYIIDINLSEAQRGTIGANITKFRTQVSGSHGHSLVTRKEEMIENIKNDRKSNEQLQVELEKLKLETNNMNNLKKLKK